MYFRKSTQLVLLIFITTTLIGCQKAKRDFYKAGEFHQGYPEIFNPIQEVLSFKIQSHTKLETNNDTIAIYIGFLKQGEHYGNWIARASNNQIMQLSTFDFKQNSNNEKDNIIDIEFNNSKNRISLKIIELDTIANKITYSWINQSTLTDSLTIQKIDVPLLQGKTFPAIELTDVNGTKFNWDSFKEQTIIINWWAVGCKPCREEIPSLNKLVDKYSNKNVKFLSITDDPLDRVSNFLKNNEFKYDITFLSENDRILFGSSYPKHIILDSTKTITFYKEGGSESISQEIDQQLTELNSKTITNK